MKKLQALNRSPLALSALAGGLFALMLVLNVLTPYICDDFTYRLNFLTREPLGSVLEIIPSMYAHSYKMNGRLISHGLVQVFMLLPAILFDLVNAALFTATVWVACRLCSPGQRHNAMLFAAMFALVWLFTPSFGQVALWQVGAINYFWSLSACVAFFAPELIRFRTGRQLLDRRWKQALFGIFAFFFGWYNEIASFVGICMVACLVLLDVWMNRAVFQPSRLLPVLFAGLGYLTMLLMPAQSANKQSEGFSMEQLMTNFRVCTDMLTRYALPLLWIFAALFLLGLLARLPRKTLVLSGLFALAGVCANYMPIAASYYPERCMCCTIWMLVMAIGFLAAPLSECGPRHFALSLAAFAVLAALTLPSGLSGCQDILSCYRQHAQREATIAAALENGEGDVTANVVIPATPYSGYYGLRDLSTEDPETWPNHSMALYYGLDSIIGE